MVTDVKFFNFFIDPIQVLCRKVRCRGSRAVALEVDPEATGVNIALLAVDALVWALSGVKSFMQFQVHKLGKFSSAKFALIRLLSRVKPQVGLQITCAAEPFTANLTFMGLFSCVYQIVLLEVSQLSEAFVTCSTFEGSFSTVYSKMNLQIRELAKGFRADIAFIFYFSILFLQWVWKGFVTSHVSLALDEIYGFFTAIGGHHC